MLTADHLKKFSVSVLKKEISKSNIKGYSKMKRGDLVALMLENQDKFMYLKESSHIMPDGSKMSGAVHSNDSVNFVDEYKKQFPDAPKKKVEPPKKTKEDLLKLGEKYKEFLINQSYAGTNMTKYKNRYEEFIDEVKKDKIPNKSNTFDSSFKTFTRSFDNLIRKDKEKKAERTKKKEELKKTKVEPPKIKVVKSKKTGKVNLKK